MFKANLKTILSSPILYIDIIAILVPAIQYIIDNNLLPAYLPWEGLVIIVLNLIAVQLKNITIQVLKAKVAELTNKIASLAK